MTQSHQRYCINREVALAIGLIEVSATGGVWDSTLHITRRLAHSRSHDRWADVAFMNEDDWLFDVFTNEKDLARAEKAFGIKQFTTEERVLNLMREIQKRKLIAK